MHNVTDAWDTTRSRLQQASLDLFRYGTESLAFRTGRKSRQQYELMSLEQETQLGVLGTPSRALYTHLYLCM